jgi:hypothetical protein
MNTIEDPRGDASGAASRGRDDRKLEVVTILLSDVDRAREPSEQLGWRLAAESGSGLPK